MNIYYALLLSFIAGLSTVIGSLFIYIKVDRNKRNQFITFCLAFSIAVMICISIFDLLPESIFIIKKYYSFFVIPIVIILFLISYFIIKIVNKLIRSNQNNLYKLGIISMITLIMHNLPEGVITFLSSVNNPRVGVKLTLAIMMHNIPEGIAIAVPIYYATGNKSKAIIKTLISGLSEPIGGILAYILLTPFITEKGIALILITVAGLMITLSIEQMFPETIKYHQNKYLLRGILTGIGVSLLSIYL